MDWTVRDRIPVWTRFSVRPDQLWGPPRLLYYAYQVFPGGRGGRGVGLTPHPHLEFIIRLCTNKIALKFTLLKQHIKMIVFFYMS
jgi:hypothetical protein